MNETTKRPDGTEAPIGFSLQPIYPRRGGIATAALLTCIATGKTITPMGGPGFALCPEVVQALDASRNGGKARVIVDAEDWDGLRAALDWFVKDIDATRTDMTEFSANVERSREVLERISAAEKKDLGS